MSKTAVNYPGKDLEAMSFAVKYHRWLLDELRPYIGKNIVEVGAGNGINFEHYPATVSELIAVDPEPYLRGQAEKAALHAPVRARVAAGSFGQTRQAARMRP